LFSDKFVATSCTTYKNASNKKVQNTALCNALDFDVLKKASVLRGPHNFVRDHWLIYETYCHCERWPCQ